LRLTASRPGVPAEFAGNPGARPRINEQVQCQLETKSTTVLLVDCTRQARVSGSSSCAGRMWRSGKPAARISDADRMMRRRSMGHKPMPVSFTELVDAFEFASFEGITGEHQAFLCKSTGKIYMSIEFSGEDELPDDIEDDEKYIRIPDKRELGLGKHLVLNFARECLPDDFDEVRYIFSKRGAYGKFKALLARRHAIDRWHDFEAKAAERALRDWCEVNAIALAD
jgi:hypothetical protein